LLDCVYDQGWHQQGKHMPGMAHFQSQYTSWNLLYFTNYAVAMQLG